jgi:uncharacterized protein VirK/YbjX
MSGTIDFPTGNENSTPTANRTVAGPRYIVAKSGEPFSLLRFGVVLWRGLTHLRTHRDVLHLLLSVPPFDEIVQKNPRFAYKYLTDDYLARGFSVSDSAACFLHHYRRLQELLPDSLLRQILQEEVTVHAIPEGGERFALTMGLSRPFDNEGELTLRLRVDGDIVFVVSFTIVPGWVVESQAAEVFLITRLQGIKGCYRQIGDATKAMHDVAPARLLLAALQGVADAFGIGTVAAIPADRQTSYSMDCALAFKEAYDDLFTELGLSMNTSGFFSSALPIEQKPLTSIKRGHKLRAKKKRAFKQQIQLACADFFKASATNPSTELSN